VPAASVVLKEKGFGVTVLEMHNSKREEKIVVLTEVNEIIQLYGKFHLTYLLWYIVYLALSWGIYVVK